MRAEVDDCEMGAIHVHEFMSLDGVIDAPTWTFDYGFDPRMGEAILAVTQRARGILLGRTTYEMFEPAWSTRTADDDPGAPFFNDTTKYVVSATLTTPTWRNSQIIGRYDPEAIRRLKDDIAGDLYVSGSGTLVRALLADGLVDELHLFVYPLTRGEGPRLFPANAMPGKLSLAATESYENGVVYLAYRPQP
jgi:dihydrofolate reductase